MLLLIKRNTAICKLASLEGYKKKRKMNEFKEKKNGEGRFLRLPRLSYRDETIRVTFAMWYTLMARAQKGIGGGEGEWAVGNRG